MDVGYPEECELFYEKECQYFITRSMWPILPIGFPFLPFIGFGTSFHSFSFAPQSIILNSRFFSLSTKPNTMSFPTET